MQTQSQTKSNRIKLPEIHDIKKILDTNTIPEKQKKKTANQGEKSIKIKPRFGQGRVRVKCKKPHITKNIDTLTDKLQGIPKIPASQNIAKIEQTFQCINNQ